MVLYISRRQLFYCHFKQATTKTTSWQRYYTCCVPAQTLGFVDLYSLLSEAQTSGIRRRVNSCGWVLHARLCVVRTISLCVSDSFCEPPVLSWYRSLTQPPVSGSKSKRESGKLRLAPSQRGDFPLLRSHVWVWLCPNRNTKLTRTLIPMCSFLYNYSLKETRFHFHTTNITQKQCWLS